MNFVWRLKLLSLAFSLVAFLLLARLFYWQVLASGQLTDLALTQQQTTLEVPARRGEILTSDGSFLVANQPAYLAYLSRQSGPLPEGLAEKLAPIVYLNLTQSTTPSAQLSAAARDSFIDKAEATLTERLKDENLVWIPLARKLTVEQKDKLEALSLESLFFEADQSRFYPEASMAAHLAGFVGLDDQGRDTGYHGLEGYYQQELSGRPGIIRQEKDAFGQPIVIGSFSEQATIDGRKLKLHLDRGLEYLVEKKLEAGVERYGAKAGSVTVIDPKTGAVLAMASFPAYDPMEYYRYDRRLFLNPVTSQASDPVSFLKIFVMAAALEEEAVEPDTRCDICSGPVKIDKYTINTWNDEYFPDSTVTDIIVHSDNVGMVFVGQKLGLDKFLDYFKKFGFTQKTGIDLQDEVTPEPKADNRWTYVDLATASFGQGFLATGMQLLAAVSSIANGGELVTPQVVDIIVSDTREIEISPQSKVRVVSPETAEKVTAMMVAAVKEGEAKWTAAQGYEIAGKTGTAQIAVGGQYQEETTNASFIGFAPANDPKFAMLVTLKEPSTSPWASETAAPLWFSIARDLLNHFNVVPNP